MIRQEELLEQLELKELGDGKGIKILREVWKNKKEDSWHSERGYVATVKLAETTHVIKATCLHMLLHDLGHLLLAITNDVHHSDQGPT